MRYVGTWSPKDVTAEREQVAFDALTAAYDAGYTLFDHADIYCRGACEEVHGKFLSKNPSLRARTVIATKCGIRFPDEPSKGSPHRYDFSAEHIVWSCEQSLRRLQVDAIDVYQLHRPDYLMDPAEIAEAFAKLQAQGKVRFFGVSNFPPSKVSALQSHLPFPLVVNQVEVHLGRLAPFEDGTLDQCLEMPLTPLSWSPLGGGFLGAGAEVPEGRKALAAMMDAMAEERGVTRTEIALAWLTEHPSGIVPIVGSSNPAHIKHAAKALEVQLGREDWYRLLVAARGEPLP